MLTKAEVSRWKEITASQQKVGGVPKNGENSECGSDCAEKGKAAGTGDGKLDTVDKVVSDSPSYAATGTHRSRPWKHVVPVSQPRVSQTE